MAAPADSRTPSSSAVSAASSHAEAQKLLRAEIDALKALLEERFREISVLTERLEQLTPASSVAAPVPPAAAVVLAPIQAAPAEAGQAELLALLADVLQASMAHGPANGVPGYDRQVQILSQSPLFDATWYLQAYPDVQASGMDPREHYARAGAFEGRNPGPGFDTISYYLANPDVAEAGWPALVHFAGFGQAEGRSPA